jgi:hypothetical protein
MQKEQNVVRHQAPPRQDLDREEISSGEHVHVAWYQARMVSGLAAQATFARALRPSRVPISAGVHRSGSDRRSRAGRCARRIRFSAARYSFLEERFLVHQSSHIRKKTSPLIAFMPIVHHRRSLILRVFEYLDHKRTLAHNCKREPRYSPP